MRRLAFASLALAACVPPGSYGGWSGTSPSSSGGAPADTPPPSPDLAVTGAARGLTQLTTAPGGETRPTASPDGKSILFTAWTNQIAEGQDTATLVEETISAIRPDGRGLTVYSSRRAFASDATWLGERGFAYVSNAMGDYQIVRASRLAANAATTVVVRADAAPEVGGLSASRDGKLLAFHARMQGHLVVATVRPDGTDLTNVAEGSYPRISPDAQRLVFQRQVGDSWRIFIASVDGGDETQVTDGEIDCDTPTWSPDAAWIVMSCNGGWQRFPDATADVRNLYAVRPDGSELTQLTDGARFATFPDYAVDGSIYFASNEGGTVDLWKLTPVLPK
jgi:Tol biopolymer transport system component